MGFLTESQKSELLSKLHGKIGCATCAYSNHSLHDEILALPIVERGVPSGLSVNDQKFVPIVMAICSSCSRASFFAATPLISLT